jgi:hypothetical protein
MPRKRLPRTKQPRPPSGRDLKARAEALRITAKALAICDGIKRGDRTIGFVGPPANREGIVAAQTEEDS